MHLKLVKVQGDFMWHHHDVEDELFLVTKVSATRTRTRRVVRALLRHTLACGRSHARASLALGSHTYITSPRVILLVRMAQGTLNMGIRDPEERVEVVREGEFIIIPRMVEHRPSAEAECEIILLEPKSTLNTGTVEDHELTVKELGLVE